MSLERSVKYLLIVVVVLLTVSTNYSQTAAELQRATQLFNQGVEKYKRGQYDAAIADYTAYIKIRPDQPTGWFNRGIAYKQKAEDAMSRPDFENAAADFTQAIKLNAKDADFWINRGWVYARLMAVDFNKYLPLAVADFTAGIKLNPVSASAYRGRGMVYEDSNQKAKALPDLNQAIKLDPTNAVAFFTRAKVHGYSKNYVAALADIDSALRLFPNYEAAKTFKKFVIDEQNKTTAKATAKTPAKITTKPPTVTKPVPTNTPAPVTDSADGFKRAEEAEKLRDHRKVIDIVTKTLPLIPMQSEGLPAKDFDEFVYLDLLKKRAKAYLTLKLYKEAQDEYSRVVLHSIKNMNRHNAKANEEMRKDMGSGGGAIMATVQTASSTIICKSTFTAASEWVDTLDREKTNDMAMRLSSSILLAAMREACATAYTMDGGFEEAKAYGYFGASIKTKQLTAAVDRYTSAIQYSQIFRDAYVARAKAYRGLGRNDLAVVDEKKAAELATKK